MWSKMHGFPVFKTFQNEYNWKNIVKLFLIISKTVKKQFIKGFSKSFRNVYVLKDKKGNFKYYVITFNISKKNSGNFYSCKHLAKFFLKHLKNTWIHLIKTFSKLLLQQFWNVLNTFYNNIFVLTRMNLSAKCAHLRIDCLMESDFFFMFLYFFSILFAF